MPEWLFGGLVTLCGSVLIASGVWLGHILSARTQRVTAKTQAEAQVEVAQRTAEATVAVAEKSNEQVLIDQLQEELTGYRTSAEARATAQDERMERIEKENANLRAEREGYRDYAHQLRTYIYDGHPPPPPEWPDGLPR